MTSESEKFHVDTPNHFLYGGESLWATHIRDDLYSIDNIPFAAYGINTGDVVRVSQTDDTMKPEIVCVVEKCGNETIRIITDETTPEDVKKTML